MVSTFTNSQMCHGVKFEIYVAAVKNTCSLCTIDLFIFFHHFNPYCIASMKHSSIRRVKY